jgi:hypothetical protein
MSRESKSSSLRVIVSGLIAKYPLGGMTWHYLQYVLGLAQLGHDVYYIESSGEWPYNPISDGAGPDCTYNVNYLSEVMSRFGLDDKWAYYFSWKSQWFGLSDRQRSDVIGSADLLINVSGTLPYPNDYREVERLAYVDTDPVFTQLRIVEGDTWRRDNIDQHDVVFSFGERAAEMLPDTGHHWRPTRQPVVLNQWHVSSPARDVFTTVMNWSSYASVTHGGQFYGQKNMELLRFVELPRLVAPVTLELAIAPGRIDDAARQDLTDRGWHLVDPMQVCPDLVSYRAYIQSSHAEWSVAKNGYVRGKAGWFSDRSACYLAAGRPVVVQDTGLSAVLPTGKGLLTFTTLEEAVAAIEEVNANYDRHSRAARAIAETYFDSDKVLSQLIEAALDGNRPQT